MDMIAQESVFVCGGFAGTAVACFFWLRMSSLRLLANPSASVRPLPAYKKTYPGRGRGACVERCLGRDFLTEAGCIGRAQVAAASLGVEEYLAKVVMSDWGSQTMLPGGVSLILKREDGIMIVRFQVIARWEFKRDNCQVIGGEVHTLVRVVLGRRRVGDEPGSFQRRIDLNETILLSGVEYAGTKDKAGQ
jgi:hypothetical protein